jgi:hypothetical protein
MRTRRVVRVALRCLDLPVPRVWGETGRRHDFGPDEAMRLIGTPERPKVERPIEDRIEAR